MDENNHGNQAEEFDDKGTQSDEHEFFSSLKVPVDIDEIYDDRKSANEIKHLLGTEKSREQYADSKNEDGRHRQESIHYQHLGEQLIPRLFVVPSFRGLSDRICLYSQGTKENEVRYVIGSGSITADAFRCKHPRNITGTYQREYDIQHPVKRVEYSVLCKGPLLFCFSH